MRKFYKITLIFAGLLLFFSQSNAKITKQSLLGTLRSTILKNADGRQDSLASVEQHRATVFVFFSSECPISNSYMPLLSRLSSEFKSKDIDFYGVIADPDVASDQAKKFSTDYQFPSDILMDSKQELASLLKAHITPEAIVISRTGKIEYQGRIDDKYVALGKGRMMAKHNDLYDALVSISEGKKVKNSHTKVIGCWIPKLEK